MKRLNYLQNCKSWWAISKIDKLASRIGDLEVKVHAGWVPSITKTGERAWIRGRGSGLQFLRELTKWMRDNEYPAPDTLPEDLREQVDLWSRAEVDGSNFGELARMNRTQARRVLGIEENEIESKTPPLT